MNNLTAREKGFMYVVTLLIIVVLGYFFGIRTLNNKYDDYREELQTLQEKKEFLGASNHLLIAAKKSWKMAVICRIYQKSDLPLYLLPLLHR